MCWSIRNLLNSILLRFLKSLKRSPEELEGTSEIENEMELEDSEGEENCLCVARSQHQIAYNHSILR